MSRPSTLRPDGVADTYADGTVTTIRVYRLRPNETRDAEYGTPGEILDSDGYVQSPWQIDGFNEHTRECTEEMWVSRSRAEALGVIPAFIEENALTFAPRPTYQEPTA